MHPPVLGSLVVVGPSVVDGDVDVPSDVPVALVVDAEVEEVVFVSVFVSVPDEPALSLAATGSKQLDIPRPRARQSPGVGFIDDPIVANDGTHATPSREVRPCGTAGHAIRWP